MTSMPTRWGQAARAAVASATSATPRAAARRRSESRLSVRTIWLWAAASGLACYQSGFGLQDVGGDDAPIDVTSEGSLDGGSECWSDPSTGFEWQVVPVPELTWFEGTAYCDELVLCGQADWRLPSVGELRSIIRGCRQTVTGGECPAADGYEGGYVRSCNGCSDRLGPGSDGQYLAGGLQAGTSRNRWTWSSSQYVHNSFYGWCIFFGMGQINFYGRNAGFHVRCVRGRP